MRVEELRIGNWVSYKGKNYQIYDGIRSLSIDDLDNEFLDSHLKNIKLSELEPIELTEEILLKCKSIKEKQGRLGKYYYFEPYSLLRFFFDKNKLVVIKEDFNKSIWLQEVEYTHQLQNLFFVLSGKELEINGL